MNNTFYNPILSITSILLKTYTSSQDTGKTDKLKEFKSVYTIPENVITCIEFVLFIGLN
ncbi:hypothetical protein [uncultured Methanobrevibacter sp.]|uniref:hypothetical protein n=1 Tax=uncultured Methanobrevibacter sp. TaxID=253161 RepID=UPI0025DADC6F|nr:hypothetical protein [uncultured Methanobrevibacter sp.]